TQLRSLYWPLPDLSMWKTELDPAESVRLVNGNSLCSGRVEVKSNQSWSSVCEADFDQQDAEVVCRELSCGAPSVFQGRLQLISSSGWLSCLWLWCRLPLPSTSTARYGTHLYSTVGSSNDAVQHLRSCANF
uniref:SRCR domain-containing protein n=1 Tax=Myripristis murdjan TaxID=586833 RepID=A0A667WZ06_9TELE